MLDKCSGNKHYKQILIDSDNYNALNSNLIDPMSILS